MASFTKAQILAAWNNTGKSSEKGNNVLFRVDICGALIYFHSYGKKTLMGWEVDHIFPEAKGGGTEPVNLRAMQHQNNSSKGKNYPNHTCVISQNKEATNRTVHINTRTKLVKLYGKKAK